MALLKIVSKTYETYYDLNNLIHYVLNPDKIDTGVCGFNLLYPYQSVNNITNQMIEISDYYGKSYGTLAYHYIISYNGIFSPNMIKIFNKAMSMLISCCNSLIAFPSLYALHENTCNFHFHLVVGATNLYTGKKLINNKALHDEMAKMLWLFSNYEKDRKIYFFNYDIVYE